MFISHYIFQDIYAFIFNINNKIDYLHAIYPNENLFNVFTLFDDGNTTLVDILICNKNYDMYKLYKYGIDLKIVSCDCIEAYGQNIKTNLKKYKNKYISDHGLYLSHKIHYPLYEICMHQNLEISYTFNTEATPPGQDGGTTGESTT